MILLTVARRWAQKSSEEIHDVTCLDRLCIGDKARVVRVTGADDITIRLLEMGLTPGVAVELLGAAPLGDPIELELRGYRLSIRKSEAARVEIEPLKNLATEANPSSAAT
jgi:ferrous iron transport protein A